MQDKEKDKAEELRRKREELKKNLLGGKFVSQKNDNPVEENPEHDSHPQSISDEPMDELLRKEREAVMARLFTNIVGLWPVYRQPHFWQMCT